jgi:hypothetical protein
MSVCASCGSQLSDGSSLCRHHHVASEDGWAAGNRILCDLLHRGVVPSRLSPDQREDPETSA